MLETVLTDHARRVNTDQPPASGMPQMVYLDAAVAKVQRAIISFADDHLQYLFARQAYQTEVLTRADKSQPLPPRPRPPAPLGVVVTTGVGKTRSIAQLVNSGAADIAFFILLKNHKLAAELADHINEDVKVLKYHGRSDDKESAAHCQQSKTVVKLGAQRRLVQPLLCQSCPHGMHTMLDRYRNTRAFAGSQEARVGAEDKIDRLMGKAKNLQTDILSHAPCAWLDHQQAALNSRVIIGTHDSFGPALAMFDGQPRVILVDEAAPLARGWAIEIKHVTEWTSRIKEERNRTTAKLIERNLSSSLMAGADGEQAREINKAIKDLQDALETLIAGDNLLKQIKIWLSESIKSEVEVYPTPEIIAAAAVIETIQTIQDSAAQWERATMRPPGGGEQIVPLRSAVDLAWAIRNGTAYSLNGTIHATSLTSLGAALVGGHHSLVFLDATMPKSTTDAILRIGGKVERITARQNIKIVHYQDRAHLRGGFIDPEHPERARAAINKEKKRLAIAKLIISAEVNQEDFGVITHQPLAEAGEGYWGRDELGRDHLNGKHLVLFGDPIVHPTNLRSEYEASRAVAIAAGCDASGWPRWSDAGRARPLVRVSSARGLMSKVSLPSDPYLLDWALGFFTARFTQAVGRVRGVRAPKTRIIHVWAGLPIDWRQIGVEVEIRSDPAEAGKKRGGGTGGAQPQAGEFLMRLAADMKVLILAGKTPGRRNVEELRGSGINPGRFQRDRAGALRTALVEIGDGELASELSRNADALKAGWIAEVAEAALDAIDGA